jgi:hypothetical protein
MLLTINKNIMEKLREKCKLRYLISQHGSFMWLCLKNIFI